MQPLSPKPRVLLVDDEPDMRDFVERVLRRTFEVTQCDSAEDALLALAADRFDLLITDQKMPRCSGLELIARIGETQPQLVKILLTGFAEAPDVEHAIAAGQVHAFVLKPVDAAGLSEVVEEALASARVRPDALPRD